MNRALEILARSNLSVWRLPEFSGRITAALVLSVPKASVPSARRTVSGTKVRCLRGGRPARRRRYGRGVSRARYQARSRRRDQGPRAGRSPAIPIAWCASSARRRRSPSLNHPHIAQIYGLEDDRPDVAALVMELVDGEDLAERIARGAIPAGRGASDRAADRRGARGRARAGHRPSRSQAREHQGPRRMAPSRCSTSGSRRRWTESGSGCSRATCVETRRRSRRRR